MVALFYITGILFGFSTILTVQSLVSCHKSKSWVLRREDDNTNNNLKDQIKELETEHEVLSSRYDEMRDRNINLLKLHAEMSKTRN